MTRGWYRSEPRILLVCDANACACAHRLTLNSESHADPYEKRKEERLTWQTDFHAAQGSVIVHVQRGSFVSPAALADHADGLYFRHGIRSTDPPAGYHEDLAYVFELTYEHEARKL